MRRVLIVALALLLPALALTAQIPTEPPLPDDPLRGRRLLERKGCLQCHDVTGDTYSVGPALGDGGFGGTFLDLGAALWNHVPAMSLSVERAGLEWPEFREREVLELIAFLYFVDYLGRPGDANAGADIFASASCGDCHAVEGIGGGIAPDLTELNRFASPLYLAQQIWNHGPDMLAEIERRNLRAPRFEPGDLADLSAYIRQRSVPGPQEPELFAPGSPNRGQSLFASAGCSICHGRDARGRGAAPDLATRELPRSAEAIAGTLWNHALGMRNAMAERGMPWPELDGTEMADLVAYLYFLPFHDPPGDAARGVQVFAERGCANCHGPGEPGTTEASSEAPDLSSGGVASTPAALIAKMWNHAPSMKREALSFGRPWPELTGEDLRHLSAMLRQE